MTTIGSAVNHIQYSNIYLFIYLKILSKRQQVSECIKNSTRVYVVDSLFLFMVYFVYCKEIL